MSALLVHALHLQTHWSPVINGAEGHGTDPGGVGTGVCRSHPPTPQGGSVGLCLTQRTSSISFHLKQFYG